MAQVSKYRYLLNQYPETVQKEQFRIICHISKRTARYLLQSGLVPCVQSGKKTRNYTITAFNLASWLAARGAEVAYIEVNQNRHLQLLLNIYEAAPDGEHYTIDGIDCYLTNEPDKAYQFMLMLFTWPILEQFTPEKVKDLISYYRVHKKPMIELANGWYHIEILGGETLQDGDYEPTFEFVIQPATNEEATINADMNFSFEITSSAY